MHSLTFSARDSQKAMAEVLRRLGPDAMILSTRMVGGLIEIRATNDALMNGADPAALMAETDLPRPAPAAAKPARPRRSVPQRAARPTLDQALASVDPGLVAAPAPAPVAPHMPPAPAVSRNPLLRAEPPLIARPRPPVLPPRAATPAQAEATVSRFEQALMEEGERPAMASKPAPRSRAEADLTEFSRRLLPPETLAQEIAARTVIIGPPGAGKSLLAARLAAQMMCADRTIAPRLIAPVPGPRLVEDRLRGWARLMGLSVEAPTVAQTLAMPEPDMITPEIIDLSDVGDHTPEVLARLVDADDVDLILCLPTGMHPAHLDRLCREWSAWQPAICLTRLDQWEPEHDELATLTAHGLKLTRIAEGTGILNTLRRPCLADLRHWAAGWPAGWAAMLAIAAQQATADEPRAAWAGAAE